MYIGSHSRIRAGEVTEIRLGDKILLLVRPGRVWPAELAPHRVNAHRIGAVLQGFRQHRHEIGRLREYWHRNHLGDARLGDEALLQSLATAIGHRRVEALVLPRMTRVVGEAASSVSRPSGDAGQTTAANPTSTPSEKNFTQWDLSDRLAYVLTEAVKKDIGPEIVTVLRGFLTKEGMAWLAVFVGLEITSHAAGGVGFLADAALVGVLWTMCGVSAFNGMIAFADFLQRTVSANSKVDLDVAAEDLARAAVLLGIAALTFLGGWAKARSVAGRVTGGAAGETADATASLRSDSQASQPHPSTPVGRSGAPMEVPRGTNAPAVIGGRSYSGHALDEMQSDGIPPSAAENAIRNGSEVPSSRPDTSKFHDPVNRISVVVNKQGTVVTVFRQSRIP